MSDDGRWTAADVPDQAGKTIGKHRQHRVDLALADELRERREIQPARHARIVAQRRMIAKLAHLTSDFGRMRACPRRAGRSAPG